MNEKNKWEDPWYYVCLFIFLVIGYGVISLLLDITIDFIIKLFVGLCVSIVCGIITVKVYRTNNKTVWYSAIGAGAVLLFLLFEKESYSYIQISIVIGFLGGLLYEQNREDDAVETEESEDVEAEKEETEDVEP